MSRGLRSINPESFSPIGLPKAKKKLIPVRSGLVWSGGQVGLDSVIMFGSD